MRAGLIDDYIHIILSFIRTILFIPFCPYHFVRYHFVRNPYTILSVPFCPLPFCPLPFCPRTANGYETIKMYACKRL